MASSPAKGSPGLESRPRGKHSGRLLLRMPKELHGELAQAAAQDGVSLNQFISTALAKAVGWGENQPAGGELEPDAPTPRSNRPHSPRSTEADETRRARINGNRLMVALAANFVIVLVAAAIALGMLIAAWRG